MGRQEYRANYRAAFESANTQLDQMYREFEQLQLRKEMLEDALGALEPFLQHREEPVVQYHQQAPAAVEPMRAEPIKMEPRVESKYQVLPPVAEPVQASEPIAPPSFAPVPEIIVDPIQSRINRALGLAVA